MSRFAAEQTAPGWRLRWSEITVAVRSVRHTSTNLESFRKTLAKIFCELNDSKRQRKTLSSGDLITAARVVQLAFHSLIPLALSAHDSLSHAPRNSVASGVEACARWFATVALLIYTFSSIEQSRLLTEGVDLLHAQAHIPAQPASPFQNTRISRADEDQERPRGNLPPARQRTPTGFRKAWLS
jgi:hypothetical protein